MIYLEPATLGWRPILKSWINSLPHSLTKENGELLEELFEWIVDPCLSFIRKNCKEYCPSSVSNVVRSLMYWVEMLMHNAAHHEEVAENRHLRTWLISAFIFSVPWSLGAVTDVDGREKFDKFYRELLLGKNENNPVPKSLGKIEVMFPDNGLVYDYAYEVKSISITTLIQQTYLNLCFYYSKRQEDLGNIGMILSNPQMYH